MDPSTTALRVLRAVAEFGTFTAAAAFLGYTQSAVSRQISTLERDAGEALFERHAGGARLTRGGQILLRHARVILDEIACAETELSGSAPAVELVRLGALMSAGPVMLPTLVRDLRIAHPNIRLTTREGATPALIRALRAGTLDLAVISGRPPYPAPDHDLPALVTDIIDEITLMVAASAVGRFAGRDSVSLSELEDVDWVASPSNRGEPLLGVWPGLAGRPRVAHTARDWLTKLTLVAADCGLTTVPPELSQHLPVGVRLLRVEDGPPERRQLMVARLPGKPVAPVAAVIAALKAQNVRDRA